MTLLKISDLSKSFKGGRKEFFALQNVNFEINQSDFINIIGKSGSGKSTLLRLLSGLIIPTSGEILPAGKNIFDMNDAEISLYRNEYVGYVPQSLGLIYNLNVFDNIRLPYFFERRDGDGVDRASDLLKNLKIDYLQDEMPANLSGGEFKRVLIARALMNNPKILLLDEPTSDLDSETTTDIMNYLKEINELGTSIVMVTHDFDLLKYGNRLFRMKDGVLNEEK